MTDKISKSTYDIALLMQQTRVLAADYRNSTGQALPVTAELARFDAIDKLNLVKLNAENGVEAIDDGDNPNKYLIKGRVIFKGGKARQKLGHVSLDSDWDFLLMVLYDADYMATHIYKVERKVIESQLEATTKDKRGSMTVAKYKALGELVWTIDS